MECIYMHIHTLYIYAHSHSFHMGSQQAVDLIIVQSSLRPCNINSRLLLGITGSTKLWRWVCNTKCPCKREEVCLRCGMDWVISHSHQQFLGWTLTFNATIWRWVFKTLRCIDIKERLYKDTARRWPCANRGLKRNQCHQHLGLGLLLSRIVDDDFLLSELICVVLLREQRPDWPAQNLSEQAQLWGMSVS